MLLIEGQARTPHEDARRRSRVPAWIGELPWGGRFGLILLVAGLATDVAAHAGPLRSEGLANAAHVLVLGGMVLALIGSFVLGIRTGHDGERGNR